LQRTVVQCRECGKRMKKDKTDAAQIGWVCECGFSDRTPSARQAIAANPQRKEDIFARIRFKEGGDVMLEVSRTNSSQYELLSLDEISRLVSAEIPLSDILGEITGKIARRMSVEVCSIYLNRGGQLVLSATHGLAKDAVGKIRLGIGEGITGAAAMSGKPVAVQDAAADPRYRHFAVAREEKYKAMLSYPIKDDGRVVGVINVQTVRSRNFTPSEISYIAIVANLIRTCLRLRDRVRDIHLDPPPDGR
jgi:putative methionine-R-sulfoxide reductase with GAF domain